jgi:putative PIN family toxin of toxin-antitoxin system
LEELTAVLRYPKLRVITSHPLVAVVLEWLHRPEHIVIPQERIDIIRADRGDNLVLEGAVAVGADAIVSGDRHLRALKQFRGIPILQAREFGAKHLW